MKQSMSDRPFFGRGVHGRSVCFDDVGVPTARIMRQLVCLSDRKEHGPSHHAEDEQPQREHAQRAYPAMAIPAQHGE